MEERINEIQSNMKIEFTFCNHCETKHHVIYLGISDVYNEKLYLCTIKDFWFEHK